MTTSSNNNAPSLLQPVLDALHSQSERCAAKQVANAVTTDDLWSLLEKRVPPVASEYFRGGADDEVTLQENVMAFRQSRTTAWGA